MSDKELISEATAHIDNTLAGIGTDESSVRAAWARGEGSDDRFSLLVRLRDRLANALEARQPSGDDREALVRVVANHPIAPLMRLGGDAGYPLADAILAAGFSRAAVPDATTEEFESLIYPDYEGLAAAVFERSHEPAFSDDSRGLREARAFAESLVEMYIDQQGLKQLKAERDAALAAIDRARAVCLHLGGVDGDVSQPAPSYYVSVGRNVVATEVLAALDGAPEPEWEYGLLNPQAPASGKLQGGAHLISKNREHIIAQQRKGHPAIQAVRRRKAGPWLPVEGESGDA